MRKIQFGATFVAGALARLTNLVSRLSRKIKSATTIALLVAIAVLAGHSVSALSPPTIASLKTVTVPEPDNLGQFLKIRPLRSLWERLFFGICRLVVMASPPVPVATSMSVRITELKTSLVRGFRE